MNDPTTSDPTMAAKWLRIWGVLADRGPLLLVIACTAAMSWTGLTGFAHDELKLHSWLQYAVAIALDGAAMASARLAVRAVVLGDSGAGARLMTCSFVGASAYFNWHHALIQGLDTSAALFFGAMSIATYSLFELVLRQLRRTALREEGALYKPLARFRILRWLRFPKETFAGWSTALRFNITSPDEVMALVWQSNTVSAEPEPLEQGTTKRAALESAFAHIGGVDVPAALEWLTERGITMDRAYAYDVAKRARRAPELSGPGKTLEIVTNGVSQTA